MGKTFFLNEAHAKFVPGGSSLGIMNVYGWIDHLRWGGWLWALFPGLPCTLPFVVMLIAGIQLEVQYRVQGITTTATVSSCERRRPENNRGGDLTYITYLFSAVDVNTGQEHPLTETFRVSNDMHNLLCEDVPAQFSVVYLPNQPELARVLDERINPLWMNLFANFALFIGLGIPALFMVWCTWQCGEAIFHELQIPMLERKGKLLDGEVVKAMGRRNRDGKYLVTLHYKFTVQKKTRRGKFTQMRQDLYGNLPPAGTPITVLYANRFCHLPL